MGLKRRILNFILSSTHWENYPDCQDWEHGSKEDFGRLCWINIVGLITDLVNDVTFTNLGDKPILFGYFKAFFEQYGEAVLVKLFDEGRVVVGVNEYGFSLVGPEAYMENTLPNGAKVLTSKLPNTRVYEMVSPSYLCYKKSDKELCKPAVTFVENALNASDTCTRRMGSLVVASPEQASGAPTMAVLTKEDKQEIEKEVTTGYGALKAQKQLMILPKAMKFQTINLAGLDQQTEKKVKLGICLICDRLRVPANQVAIIDANGSKSFANGSELREGDFNKYQTFERLLQKTFCQLAKDVGLNVDYTIYNKPVRTQTV